MKQLRSRQEIKDKIDELQRAIDSPPKTDPRVTMCIVIFIVSYIFFLFIGGNFLEIWNYTGIPIFAVGLLWSLARVKWLKIKRVEIARTLEDVLAVLDKPDGSEVFYQLLDRSIVERNKNRTPYIVSLIKRNYSRITADAQVEARSWVASPSGVSGQAND